jgi:hypothetical protein
MPEAFTTEVSTPNVAPASANSGSVIAGLLRVVTRQL